jgi:hypothetical protein
MAHILKADIEILAGYEARDWALLRPSMLKALSALDDKARIYTRPFFNNYIRDWNGGQDEASDLDLRNFVLHYTSIALHLKLKNAIDDYQIVHGFLDGLPRAWHTHLMDTQNINLEELQMVEFDTLRIWVLNRLDAKADEHYFDRRGSIYSLANTRLRLDMPPDNLQSS